ncbi:uncharacterized protein I206_102474 [Kwoniella pini CBS 10737]|uniref:Carboxylesterase type B domain-containing protein n=1 Tax=Kwoniella pini CBS 10737 TaxID=1296096 RepID=A0A1B9I5H1_9TREE|nr:uncharacterized protein I206_02825 [Kwoniella pini CBS 10737]OCF50769.1 hypothetical protein I206_02825 [Kwoniella pini CBS 10737]
MTILFISLSILIFIRIISSQSIWDNSNRISDDELCLISILGITVKGLLTNEGACRYTVKYGISKRWKESYSTLNDLNDQQSFNNLPPSCPQKEGTYVSGDYQSEDCLFAIIYSPSSINSLLKLPILVWIHGGSYTAGSASSPGLDGSKLAIRGNMIVIILQYRLGILGFLPPYSSDSWSDPNLGLRDVILALKSIQNGIEFVGGDKDKVTIGGQSSGASIARALLGAPEAKGLFRAAILQSDPMSYGNSPNDITSKLRDLYYSQEPLKSCTNIECLENVPHASIIAAQDDLTLSAPMLIKGIPLPMVIRPTFDNPTLPSDPTLSLFSNPTSLPLWNISILLTTVKNEAGSAVSDLFPNPVPLSFDTYYATLSASINTYRANQLATSKEYALLDNTGFGKGGDEFREKYETAATDGIWKCPNRDVASIWRKNGGNVWVGEWTKGSTYPSNKDHAYCTIKGKVCHEDDIYPTFGNSPNTTIETTSIEDEVLSYWSNFIINLDPSSSINEQTIRHESIKNWFGWLWSPKKSFQSPSLRASSEWSMYRSFEDVFTIGGGQASSCPEGFWGKKVEYDWQIYGQ